MQRWSCNRFILVLLYSLTVPARRSGVLSNAARSARQLIFVRHNRALGRIPTEQCQGIAVNEDLLHRAYETARHAGHFVGTDVGAENDACFNAKADKCLY